MPYNVEEKLKQMNLTLPPPVEIIYEYVPVVVHHDVAYVSGQLPKVDGEVRVKGRVGGEVTLEQGREAAVLCLLHCLTCLKQELGSLERVSKIIKLTGHVSSADGFDLQPKVINAASELLVQLFGEAGRHSRIALGSPELSRRSPVEIELIVAID